jgi:hypothetical protein
MWQANRNKDRLEEGGTCHETRRLVGSGSVSDYRVSAIQQIRSENRISAAERTAIPPVRQLPGVMNLVQELTPLRFQTSDYH